MLSPKETHDVVTVCDLASTSILIHVCYLVGLCVCTCIYTWTRAPSHPVAYLAACQISIIHWALLTVDLHIGDKLETMQWWPQATTSNTFNGHLITCSCHSVYYSFFVVHYYHRKHQCSEHLCTHVFQNTCVYTLRTCIPNSIITVQMKVKLLRADTGSYSIIILYNTTVHCMCTWKSMHVKFMRSCIFNFLSHA